MTPEQRVALDNANRAELAIYTAFNASVENIRTKTVSAKKANRNLREAKETYTMALRELHKVMKE